MFRTVFSVALTLGVATAAFAGPQNAPNASTADQSAATTTTAPAAVKHASPIKPGDRQCIRDTGSLIPAKKGECLPVTGRSYTKDDIDATGRRTLGGALRELDPAITVRGSGY